MVNIRYIPHRPMLAATLNEAAIAGLFKRIPVIFAMQKIDGVRGLCFNGFSDDKPVILSRALKPLPNTYLQAMFAQNLLLGLDGEFIATGVEENSANTVSVVMTRDRDAPLKWLLFDDVSCPIDPYYKRYERMVQRISPTRYLANLPYAECRNPAELLAFETFVLDQKGEGVIIRDPMAPYKNGRSSLSEGGMLKLKRFHDGEAIVQDFVELEINHNTSNINELGLTGRGSFGSGKLSGGKMGALIVKEAQTGIEFNIGSGFTDKERRDIWARRSDYRGKIVKYKSQLAGVKDKPRHPVFIGWRSPIDMGE